MAGLIAHEWIEKSGGAEKVLESMSAIFPKADIACLWNDAPGRFARHRVTESWLAQSPLRGRKALALPLMPLTWRGIGKGLEYDWLLVSSHLFAHHATLRSRQQISKKFVYVHTPARYLWAPELDTRGASTLVRTVAPLYRHLDKRRAAEGASFAANSEFVRERIRATWDQDATVIYPPVNVDQLQAAGTWRDKLSGQDEAILSALPDGFLLGASRFVSYKRLDLVIKAGEAANLPVVLAGSGPQRPELAAAGRSARVPVFIVDRPSDELLYALYQAAAAFVFPAVEDFGIMPVEAMSLGTPVIVSNIGGASESVGLLRGGVALESFSDDSLRRGIDAALCLDMKAAKDQAGRTFGEGAFSRQLTSWMQITGAVLHPADGRTQ